MFNKKELIDVVHAKCGGFRVHSEEMVNLIFDTIKVQTQLTGKVSIPGFGIFTLRNMEAKNVRNPRTGAIMEMKSYRKVRFAPALSFKDIINGNRK